MSEKERKSLSHNSIKNNKILRNKFNQGIKDLYNGYFKTLVKEIDRETNKW